MLTYTFLVGAPYWDVEARTENGIIAFGMIAVHGPREPASLRSSRRGVTLSAAFDAWFSRATAVNPAERFPTAIAAVSALAEALRPAPAAVPIANAEVASRPLPVRLPSSPELGSSSAGAPSSGAAVVRSAGSPQGESSTRGGAMGVTVTRPLQSGRGLLVAAVVAALALLGAAGGFALLHQKSPVAAGPTLLAAELSALPPAALTAAPAAPTAQPAGEPRPSAIALSASPVALPAQPPGASAQPEIPGAPALSSAPAAPPQPRPPPVLPPNAGRKGGAKPRSDSSSDFKND